MPSLRVPHQCLQLQVYTDGEIFWRFRVCAYSGLDARQVHFFRQIIHRDEGTAPSCGRSWPMMALSMGQGYLWVRPRPKQ